MRENIAYGRPGARAASASGSPADLHRPREPAILVLDKATSAVDNETEAAIQPSLARLAERRTVTVIAHRLSTVPHAEQIWVLERWKVAETGTHEELVAGGGLYAALWRVQTGDATLEPTSNLP